PRGWLNVRLLRESAPVLRAASAGLASSGFALAHTVEHGAAFRATPVLIVLVPVLLGLKWARARSGGQRVRAAYAAERPGAASSTRSRRGLRPRRTRAIWTAASGARALWRARTSPSCWCRQSWPRARPRRSP